jgi:hypothetical protein
VTFEDELRAVIEAEVDDVTAKILVGSMDIRTYDRYIGGLHAHRLVLDELFALARKNMNER